MKTTAAIPFVKRAMRKSFLKKSAGGCEMTLALVI